MKIEFDELCSRFDDIKPSLRSKICSSLEKKLLEEIDFEKNEFLIDQSKIITQNTLNNIEKWVCDEIPKICLNSLLTAMKEERWLEIVDAFYDNVGFGTSSIRGKMVTVMNANDAEKILNQIYENGFESEFLRGPNTVNEVTIMKFTLGLAKYMKKHNMKKIIVGYDNRLNSKTFSQIVAEICLLHGFTVFLFSEPNPLPELSFAITNLDADIGVEITASHNDKRYNGYKILIKSGATPNYQVQKQISNNIMQSKFQKISKDILKDYLRNKIDKAGEKELMCLTSKKKTDSINCQSIKIHQNYINQIKNLIFRSELIQKHSAEIKIGYSAIHGTGFKIISKLLTDLNVKNVKYVTNMNSPNPKFPSYDIGQVLDPGEVSTANVIVNEFIKEHGKDELKNLDVLMFNDPDSDRLGFVFNVPPSEQQHYGKWKLLKANDLWLLLLWYMLRNLSVENNLTVLDRQNLFIVKSFVTSGSLGALSKKFQIECIEGNVGFPHLMNIVKQEWKQGKINYGIFEESNGFTIAGNPFIETSIKSHTLEKDGILAAALLIEIIAYAKSQNSTVLRLLDELYLDPEIGYFVTLRSQIPEKGMLGGITGEFYKKRIMQDAENIADQAFRKTKTGAPYTIAGLPVSSVKKYSTGRYDNKYWKNFPDEGIRLFLGSDNNHITIRSSGTESKIRIFVQYHVSSLNKDNLLDEKISGELIAKNILNEIKEKLENFHKTHIDYKE